MLERENGVIAAVLQSAIGDACQPCFMTFVFQLKLDKILSISAFFCLALT
jgi:hypothetical protein